MNSEELKSIGVSTGLILLNIALMAVIAVTPLSQITNLLFKVPIIGMVVFGAGLMAGRWLAKKGMKQDRKTLAVTGAGLLQFTYGVFGGGILSLVPVSIFPIALGITAVVTTSIAVGAALLVYGTGRNFRSWGKYSNYLFMGAFGTGLIGSAFAPLLILTFILVLIGFIVYLVYEIWRMKQRPGRLIMNGIGIYIAYMGVFVEILQIVISMLAEE
ncbi:MAG: Bax inhibitor-1 family protein [Candidatus Nanohalobium sp.]